MLEYTSFSLYGTGNLNIPLWKYFIIYYYGTCLITSFIYSR